MNNFRYGAYILSQYIWVILYLLLPFIIFIFVPHKNSTGTIYSYSSNTTFNESQLPTVFCHLTDLHINYALNYTVEHFNKASEIINSIKPKFNIITGDLADNFPSDSLPRYGYQIPEDFELYQNLIKKISQYPKIEMDGNHDLFGVYNYNSKQKTNNTQSRNEYRVFSTTFEIGNKNYSFITMNPFEFPSPHPPFLFYAHPSKKFLDRLEEIISSIPIENEIIALSHFPMYQWNFGSKSSRNRRFHQIMKSGRIKLFLNGHLHPKNFCIQHHRDITDKKRNGLLEIVGSDLKQHGKIGICVIDNERFSYHSIDVNEEQKLGFITNPLPDEILSSHQIFNEKSAPLRVIIYQEKKPFIYSNGEIEGELECQKTDTFWLCQKSMTLKEGKHTIILNGDLNETLHFTIGETISSFKEDVYQFETSYYYFYFIILILIFILLFFILLPCQFNIKFEEKYDLWLNGIEGQSKEMWAISILFGFYSVKMRIMNIPKFFRILLLILLFYPFFLPMNFILIEKHIGIVNLFGIICAQNYRYCVWSQYLALFYYASVLLPITLFCSMLYITTRFHPSILIDVIFQFIAIAFDVYIFLRFCNEASGFWLSLISPSFVICPILLYLSLILWRIFTKKGINDVNNVVITQPLID